MFYIALGCVLFFVYVWSFYNLPILAAGIRNLRKSRKRNSPRSFVKEKLPKFSIVVAVKNERSVIGRLLEALSRLNYPADKKEIIIVEDGSSDGTLDICTKYAREQNLAVKIVHKQISDGKSSALNCGIAQASGEIIGIFDADNVPASNILVNVCKYFDDPKVAAVQGRTLSINSDENMLTKFISYEETVWCEAFLRGKDALNLFVNLNGSCEFIRRDVLTRLDGFGEDVLSEDLDLSARLTEQKYRIRYAPDVRSWQESPSDLKRLFRQRTRWCRGTMEVAFKYGRLMAKPSWLSLDAEITLLGPFVLLVSLATYVTAFFGLSMPLFMGFFWQFLMQFSLASLTLLILLCGLALIYASKPRRVRDLLWLPFIYFYWTLQSFVALYALLLIVLRKPRGWTKTVKNGSVTTVNLVSAGQSQHE